jgi:DNA-binding NarL/FixJ family response regulator
MNSNFACASTSNGKTSGHSLQVVLVDDSILLREHVAESLGSINAPVEIRQAGDVAAGLQLLEDRPADVLILDIEMPGRSGLDLLTLARRGGFVGTIIMLTIHDHPRIRQKCMELGANFFFHKLTHFDHVAEVCHQLAEFLTQRAGLDLVNSN